MNSDGAGSGKSGFSVELCSADSKKRGKKLRDVTESEQTQSMKSSDNESFLGDTTRLLENYSHSMDTQKDACVFRKPKLISSLPYIAEIKFQQCTEGTTRNAREGHDPSASLRAGFSRSIGNN